MIEIISARKYYGSHARGTVLIVDGRPWHFTGATSRADATKAATDIKRRREQATTAPITA